MIVYRIRSPHNKIYVGQTKDLNKRIREHKCAVKTLGYDLYIDMTKYSFDAFEFKILKQCENRVEAHKFEQIYIKKYKERSINLYNLSLGGASTLGYKHTEEQRMRNSQARKKWCNENLEVMSITNKKTWAAPGNRDKIIAARAEYFKINYAEAIAGCVAGGKKASSVRMLREKPIEVYDRETESLLYIWQGKRSLSKKIGCHWSSVHRYVANKRNHKKYIFKECLL